MTEDGILAAIARSKGRAPGEASAAPELPFSAAAQARKQAEAAVRPAPAPAPVALLPTPPVYVGEIKLGFLKKKFRLYAAPEDLPGLNTEEDTILAISQLTNWHGHNGTRGTTRDAINTAKTGLGFSRQWFIPTAEIMDRVVKAMDEPGLRNTFGKGHFRNNGTDFPNHYLVAPRRRSEKASAIWVTAPSPLLVGEKGPLPEGGRVACRPVLLVPAS